MPRMLITTNDMLRAVEQGKASYAQLTDFYSRKRLMDRQDSDEILNALTLLARLSHPPSTANIKESKENHESHRQLQPKELSK